MIDVREAERRIHAAAPPIPVRSLPLELALNHILAEDLCADRAYPPFDRVAMDGIAVNHQRSEYRLHGIQAAGSPPLTLSDPDGAIEAMTGAVLPEGTTGVIPVEQIKVIDGTAQFTGATFNAGQNVHQTASDAKAGDVLVPRGQRLTAPIIGIAASIGATHVLVEARARIAVVSTGDELVPVSDTPLAHQIRGSNVYALRALFNTFGLADVTLHHLSDRALGQDPGLLAQLMESVDVLVLSGGVSAGKFDFVPMALERLKVVALFHKVAQKPGKPFLFGQDPRGRLVFGLPGNPQSALVCARRFVVPALTNVPPRRVRLEQSFTRKKALTHFQPGRCTLDDRARFVPHNGSGDFIALSKSDGFVELDRDVHSVDESVPFYGWTPDA